MAGLQAVASAGYFVDRCEVAKVRQPALLDLPIKDERRKRQCGETALHPADGERSLMRKIDRKAIFEQFTSSEKYLSRVSDDAPEMTAHDLASLLMKQAWKHYTE